VNGAPARYLAEPGGRVAGEARVPGDKSISHRAALLASVADGVSEIDGFLEGEDCRATLGALAAMGVRVERSEPGRLRVHGVGASGLRAPAIALDLGNSGTAMRLLAGLLAGRPFDTILVGDSSLMRRPMERVAAPLRRMGADIRTNDGRPPLAIAGGRALQGADLRLETPSAQVKSAILLAALDAKGSTTVVEPGPSRDHTERMLEDFGVAVRREGKTLSLEGPARLRAARVAVPGDFSSAAFLIVAALIAGTSSLVIRGVGVNPTRTALLEILARMGGDVRLHPVTAAGREPVADIEVRPSRLQGIAVPPGLASIAMDELPVLFAAAAVADGETVVTGAAELRVKESDRLAAMGEGLLALGIAAEPLPDGLRIRGGAPTGGTIDSHGDHRVAMAFAVLAARASGPVEIRGAQNVATSFPGFTAVARAVGLRLEEGS
jgi:3-phosphoshikimate 1-carboxyvinyltransferase